MEEWPGYDRFRKDPHRGTCRLSQLFAVTSTFGRDLEARDSHNLFVADWDLWRPLEIYNPLFMQRGLLLQSDAEFIASVGATIGDSWTEASCHLVFLDARDDELDRRLGQRPQRCDDRNVLLESQEVRDLWREWASGVGDSMVRIDANEPLDDVITAVRESLERCAPISYAAVSGVR
jgi:hypothetical protein